MTSIIGTSIEICYQTISSIEKVREIQDEIGRRVRKPLEYPETEFSN
jgi:hypothetical protein